MTVPITERDTLEHSVYTPQEEQNKKPMAWLSVFLILLLSGLLAFALGYLLGSLSQLLTLGIIAVLVLGLFIVSFKS